VACTAADCARRGGVNLYGAAIGSALELDGAKLDSTAHPALRA
jgi:hypothetical protein